MAASKPAVSTAAGAAKDLQSAALNAEKKLEAKLTYLWSEIPSWQQDNHYITSGYRGASNSYAKSWKSLLYIHNETVNIYTHLLGAVIFLVTSYLLFGELKPRYDTASKEDVYVFACFFAGAVACLGMSGTYHTIQNHSHPVAVWGNKLDYLGIVFLIWGSFIPVLYYAFPTDPHLMKTYWTMVRPPNHPNPIPPANTPDHNPGRLHLRRLHTPAVPHARAAPRARPHVRADGSVRRRARAARHPHLRGCAPAARHRAQLGGAAGRAVYCRCRPVCGARPGEVGAREV